MAQYYISMGSSLFWLMTYFPINNYPVNMTQDADQAWGSHLPTFYINRVGQLIQ